ncbi:hypothetical protein IMZ48_07985 [Candidatus Bathyarchaeota archaeon]|nr:hypothetical protein [Candidatus Bathyarchaeota archaeon]
MMGVPGDFELVEVEYVIRCVELEEGQEQAGEGEDFTIHPVSIMGIRVGDEEGSEGSEG